MVTGANAGLGHATAMALAARRANVHMVCRNKERGEAALAEIKLVTSNPNVWLHVVDVADANAVRSFAAQFIESGEGLDCLVNNAGVLLPERQVNAAGIEMGWATMMNQTYLLTALLIPVRRLAQMYAMLFAAR